MTVSSTKRTEKLVRLAGSDVSLTRGGAGEPLLILHDEMGDPGWLKFHDTLGQDFNLYMPSHPGFGDSPRLDWVMTMRDMAGWYLEALDDLGLGPVNVMGFSLGGWIAAEMATMNPELFKKLILVSPMGVKPPEGEIFDMFLVTAKEFLTASFADPENTPEFETVCPEEPTPEQAEYWEVAREQASRLGWKPYMYYAGLPHLLSRLKNLPTCIIWGQDDPIVPLSSGYLYRDSIPGSRLDILDNCGHHPELERTDEFTSLVRSFLIA